MAEAVAVPLPFGGFDVWGGELDTELLSAHRVACEEATGPAKGDPLEQMLTWLLPHVRGLTAQTVNRFSFGRSSEIDISLWNDITDSWFPGFGDTVLVECKNWEEPVDSSSVAWFDWKLRLGGQSTGILVAANGITGNASRLSAAWNIIAIANTEGRRILVLTMEELCAVADGAELRELLKQKLLKLAARSAQV